MTDKTVSTLTLLFSDIQGSTNLLHELGDDYSNLLADHQKIVRDAIVKFNGKEVDTAGDSFFIIFQSANEALNAAVGIQKNLHSRVWKNNVQVRVRMGLHSGEPKLGLTGYFGMDVHLAARIMSAGHGGQILISETTRDLIISNLSDGVSLIDLGDQQLKDIPKTMRIYQAVIPGLQSEFPPIKTSTSIKNNIPVRDTKLIGREFNGDAEFCLNISILLSKYWILRGLINEGLTNARNILGMKTTHEFPVLRAKLLYNAGVFANDLSYFEDVINYYDQCQKILKTNKDDQLLAKVKGALGLTMINTFQFEKAKRLCIEAKILHDKLGNKIGVANSLSYLSYILIEQGNLIEAKEILKQVI